MTRTSFNRLRIGQVVFYRPNRVYGTVVSIRRNVLDTETRDVGVQYEYDGRLLTDTVLAADRADLAHTEGSLS